jgi:hypothetical protein
MPMEKPVPQTAEAHWNFYCPECGLGDRELGHLAKDHEIYCEICEHEEGRMITLQRWLADLPLRDQALLRAGLAA